MRNINFIFCVFFFCVSAFLPIYGADKKDLSNGQTIYIPAYSHIYFGNREKAFMLTITLSIRNMDPIHRVSISEVDYYATQGKQLKGYIDKPVILKPLGSLRFVVPESDKGGGSGANFLVKWSSDALINPPIVESIMIGTQNQQGISFTSQGREIIQSKQ